MKNKIRILCVLLGVIIIGCLLIYIKYYKFAGNIKFKKEYESLNGSLGKNNKVVRNIIIPKDNPFVYTNAEKILNKIENKEDFIVYFGFSDCPWCRSIIPTFIEVTKELKIDKVYYVDIKDIRDTLALNENKEVVSKKLGTKGYYNLLASFENVLEDYTLNYDEEIKVKTGEKRIYAPNFIKVQDGKAITCFTGISDLQKESDQELTKDILKDMYNIIKEGLTK